MRCKLSSNAFYENRHVVTPAKRAWRCSSYSWNEVYGLKCWGRDEAKAGCFFKLKLESKNILEIGLDQRLQKHPPLLLAQQRKMITSKVEWSSEPVSSLIQAMAKAYIGEHRLNSYADEKTAVFVLPNFLGTRLLQVIVIIIIQIWIPFL